MQQLHPNLKTWHITWGAYGTRLHGGDRPTVDASQPMAQHGDADGPAHDGDYA